MEFKGTKGKWVISEINISDLKSIAIFSDEKQEVLLHMYLPNREITEENKSNAKLIASAPDLLEALQEVMRVYNEKGQLLSFNVDIARKAIEKALK